jgi:mRNA interferase RelE/StbE
VAWTLEYARSVRKFVEKLDPKDRERIRRFLDERIAPLENPRTIGKPLAGPLAGLWSYRIGDFRIICDIQDRRVVILVVMIGNRRDVCR